MKGMIKQSVSKKARPLWQIIIAAFIYVVIVNYLITLCNSLGERYVNPASLVVLFFSLVVAIIFIYKFLSGYVYLLVDDKLIFKKHVRNHDKKLLEIELTEIQFLKPYQQIKSKKDITHTYKFVCDREYDKFYIGEFIREGKKYRFIFKPNKRMTDVLYKNIKEVTM